MPHLLLAVSFDDAALSYATLTHGDDLDAHDLPRWDSILPLARAQAIWVLTHICGY
jgi:hypothetical protein